jgi:hypothetical protein
MQGEIVASITDRSVNLSEGGSFRLDDCRATRAKPPKHASRRKPKYRIVASSLCEIAVKHLLGLHFLP